MFRAAHRGTLAGNHEIVASFLALLELYREDMVAFEQMAPLGDLYVTWTGGDREVVLAPPERVASRHRTKAKKRMTATSTPADELRGSEDMDGRRPGTPWTRPTAPACGQPRGDPAVADEPVPEAYRAGARRLRGETAEGLRALAAEYTADGRGFDLREIAGGWRLYTREDCAPLVERSCETAEVRLTQAAPRRWR